MGAALALPLSESASELGAEALAASRPDRREGVAGNEAEVGVGTGEEESPSVFLFLAE